MSEQSRSDGEEDAHAYQQKLRTPQCSSLVVSTNERRRRDAPAVAMTSFPKNCPEENPPDGFSPATPRDGTQIRPERQKVALSTNFRVRCGHAFRRGFLKRVRWFDRDRLPTASRGHSAATAEARRVR